MLKAIFSLLIVVFLASAYNTAYADDTPITAVAPPVVDDSLVRFAIIGDLTGGERQGVFEVAAESIAAMKPDFIISVGDLIDGGTENVDQMNREWQSFNHKLNKGDLDFYPVVGNHDISNPVMRDWYEQTVGPRYYHFIYKDALFLVLDSEDFSDDFFADLKLKRNEAIAIYNNNPVDYPNTAYAKMPQREYGEISAAQTQYMTDTIAANKQVRWVFLFMHKPVWQDDNESNFKKIEAALGGEKYTVFNGHVHGYQYTQRLGRDYIQLATTGGAMIKSAAKNMDHILWVGLTDQPSYLNIKLNGMLDKTGQVPANGDALCLRDDSCAGAR
ncbi:3',5'-cyclic adenosine monophosphate phosphodiesterase CpdA [Sinobacterium norvegicum]|uniref:3',5'-cyclic adenosine monophosphate phosphodiesterase CpdA n=1 Tax=Sinobacterium norvegicum TaxID=1641715 RepID=A0ABM9ADX3_9GAMM|nr:metallophosphoesterase [Sinobacterium norvegicum]CAH0991134.1 3',5'-cyclic adenosine monophosphate phosphodiesterase CpdA [Sinobacterium norvegicum]